MLSYKPSILYRNSHPVLMLPLVAAFIPGKLCILIYGRAASPCDIGFLVLSLELSLLSRLFQMAALKNCPR